jgi:hypothetical protein
MFYFSSSQTASRAHSTRLAVIAHDFSKSTHIRGFEGGLPYVGGLEEALAIGAGIDEALGLGVTLDLGGLGGGALGEDGDGSASNGSTLNELAAGSILGHHGHPRSRSPELLSTENSPEGMRVSLCAVCRDTRDTGARGGCIYAPWAGR